MKFNDISYVVNDRIARITFERPERLNAVRIEMLQEIIDALRAADEDNRVRVVIVTGKGRVFCAGTDLSNGFALPTSGDPETGEGIPPDPGGVVTLQLFKMRKPVIGAINGAAVGFGATFVTAMDYRIASETAKFGFVFTRRGIVPDGCSSWFLPRIVGVATALDWMLSGRMFGAAEAHAKGFVNEVVTPEGLLQRAEEYAQMIVENTAPASVAITRQLVWRMGGSDHPLAAHQFESRALVPAILKPDSREGAMSFVEKRRPVFTGVPNDISYTRTWWEG